MRCLISYNSAKAETVYSLAISFLQDAQDLLKALKQ
jgi:hypothetical protein